MIAMCKLMIEDYIVHKRLVNYKFSSLIVLITLSLMDLMLC